jgi:hypothetical protein
VRDHTIQRIQRECGFICTRSSAHAHVDALAARTSISPDLGVEPSTEVSDGIGAGRGNRGRKHLGTTMHRPRLGKTYSTAASTEVRKRHRFEVGNDL